MLSIKFEIPNMNASLSEFAIIGNGTFKDKACKLINDMYGLKPSIIYRDAQSFINDVKQNGYFGPSVIVLGSSMRYEMANSIYKELKNNIDLSFWDLSPYLDIDGNNVWGCYSLTSDLNKYQIVIVDSYYPGHGEYWLLSLIDILKSKGFSVAIIHPWQEYKFYLLENALSIVLWNGSAPFLFERVKGFLDRIGKRYLYAECGFFPQKDNFYLDRMGINAKREIARDDLSWISQHHYDKVNLVKSLFFSGINAFEFEFDYVFCPLQLSDDTNIVLNSRFSHGMQEFIYYINDYYASSALKVIFKPHPKDSCSYNYGNGIVSYKDSRALILGSARVHGINSTVLFEAVLAGKECYIEGDCLLKHYTSSPEKVLAAIISLQSSRKNINPDYIHWLTTGDF